MFHLDHDADAQAVPPAHPGWDALARMVRRGRLAVPCLVVDASGAVIHTMGDASGYLAPGAAAAGQPIVDVAAGTLRPALRQLLRAVLRDGEPLLAQNVRVDGNGSDGGHVRLEAHSLPEAPGHALLVFDPGVDLAADRPRRDEGDAARAARLARELGEAREFVDSALDRLEAFDEERRASSAQARSVNDELAAASRKLEAGRSASAQLQELNEQLRVRNQELKRLNADLDNLIESTENASMFLDERLRLRRYTPRATDLFYLRDSDVGRHFAEIRHKVKADTLMADATHVLQTGASVTRTLPWASGRCYEARLRPYRSRDNEQGGIALTFVDMTARHRHELETATFNAELAAARNYAQTVADTARQPLVVLDAALRVASANPAFYRLLATSPEQAERTAFSELVQGRWDVSRLQSLLQEVLQGTEVTGLEVRHRADAGGDRLLLLDARRIQLHGTGQRFILLALDDVTAERESRARLIESERKYRALFNAIDEGFCLVDLIHDADGQAVDYRYVEVNPAFARQSGLSGEAVGRTVRELVPEFEQCWIDTYAAVAATGQPKRFEAWVAGLQRWFHVYVFVYDASQPSRLATIFIDETQRKRAELHRELLIQELNHRVRNNLAIVQALAAQSFPDADTDPAYRNFEARLQALSVAHGLLSREHWQHALVADVIRGGLAAWTRDQPERIRMDGPELQLNPAATLALAMAIHELATNAAKYGALSNAHGTVTVRWTVFHDTRDRVRLQWLERGGPPVVEPENRGFGSWLIESGLAQDLGGSVKLKFAEHGLSCTVEAPLDSISRAP